MQSNNNKVWAFLGLVIVIVLIVVGIKSSKNGKMSNETGPIKIGFLGPLSGDVAGLGESSKNTMQLWIEKTNAAGGINGRQVEGIFEDGKCEGKASALAAQKLVTVDQVQIIIGGHCSGETMAAAPIAEEGKVLMISPASSSPAITNAGDYIFRTYPSDLGFSGELANLLVTKGVKTVGIISEQTDYAQGIRGAFLADMQAKGIQVVADENFTTDVSDFKAADGKLRDAHPDAIFINPQSPANATRIIKQLRDLGDKTQLYGVGIFTNEEFAKSGSFVNGLIYIDLLAAANKETADQFNAEYKTRFNKDSEFPIFSNFAHDTLDIVGEAIKKVGYDSEKLKDYFYNMKPHSGIVGNINFDKNGDPVGISGYIVKQIQNGEIVDYK